MRISFFEFVTNDEFVICVWKKDDSQSWDESKQIFDVNKKSFKRISKSSSNRANINHKKSNAWSICNFAKKIFEKEDDWSEEIRRNQKNSRNARSRIDRVYVIESTHSTNVITWSKNFVRLNENRTKKWWKRSKKFLKRILESKRQWNEFAKTSKNDWKKSSKKKMTRTNQNQRKRNLSTSMK